VRALLFDSNARQMEGYGARLPYRMQTTPDGGIEINPEKLAELAIDCLDELHRQVHADGLKIAAIGGSAFWHSFLGVDQNGAPRYRSYIFWIRAAPPKSPSLPDAHARTGCVRHTSYWPSKLLWLARNKPAEFAATRRWVSFSEFLYEKLFGKPRVSTSMASATGLWNQNANDYDAEMLAAVHVDRAMLADSRDMDQPVCGPAPRISPGVACVRGNTLVSASGRRCV